MPKQLAVNFFFITLTTQLNVICISQHF